ncbi:MAG: hypothetical protein OEZ22_01850 [Spirochaetia bacterium]|nr:hypothetical protein [Spirochaetia bacterium]
MKLFSSRKFLFFLSAFSIFSFFFEYYYLLPSRKQDLLKEYSISISEELNKLFSQIDNRARDGEWDKYFLIKTISEKGLNEFKKINPLIKNIALIDKLNHTIGKTFSFLSMTELSRYLKRAAITETRQDFLLETGFHSLFIVKNGNGFMGYILFEFDINKTYENNAFFLTDRGSKTIYIKPASYLNLSQKKEFHGFLNKSSLFNKRFYNTKIENKRYTLSFHFWEEKNLYMGYLETSFPLAASVGFYFMLFSLTAFAINFFIETAAPKQRMKYNFANKKLEQILNKQKDAVFVLKTELENLKEAYTGITETEKTVLSEKIEEPEAEEDDEIFSFEEGKDSDNDKIIELKRIKRKFIFVDPFKQYPESKTKSSGKKEKEEPKTQIPEEIETTHEKDFHTHLDTIELKTEEEQIREKAFTPELKTLIEEIKKPAAPLLNEDLLLKKLDNLEKTISQTKDTSIIALLKEVYTGGVNFGNFTKIMAFLRQKLHADGILFTLFNSNINCYEVKIAENLPSTIKNTFFTTERDPFMPQSADKEPVFISIDKKLKENLFFAKRFPKEINEKLKKILILPLFKYDIKGYFISFYFSDAPAKEIMLGQLNKYITELAPVFKYYFIKDKYLDSINQAKEIVKELKTISALGQKSITVLDIFSENAIDENLFNRLKTSLSLLIKANERIIYNTPFHVIILLDTSSHEKVLNKVNELISSITPKIQKFPEDKTNFYNFF